jgi:hypothetical protein
MGWIAQSWDFINIGSGLMLLALAYPVARWLPRGKTLTAAWLLVVSVSTYLHGRVPTAPAFPGETRRTFPMPGWGSTFGRGPPTARTPLGMVIATSPR